MTLSDIGIARVRTISLAIVSLACLSYAIAAMLTNQPNPTLWYIPGAVGLLATLCISIAFFCATPEARRMAHDEMYSAILHRAQRHSFWIALMLYPIFAIGVLTLGLTWNTVFAAMGTLTAGLYLLLLTIYEWQSG